MSNHLLGFISSILFEYDCWGCLLISLDTHTHTHTHIIETRICKCWTEVRFPFHYRSHTGCKAYVVLCLWFPASVSSRLESVASEIKYLGLHLDQRLTWQTHIRAKRRQLDIKFKQMLWLLGRNSILSLNNKLLLYKVVLKPIWSYGVQLWGCAK